MINRYIFVSKYVQDVLKNEPQRDLFYIFVSTILTFRRTRRDFAANDFAYIHSTHLLTLFGKYYQSQVIQPLIDLKIIECDRHYIKGAKCHGYRLLPPYDQNTSVPVINNRRLMKKLQDLHNANKENKTKLNKFIIKNQRRLQMDTRAAFVDFVANCNNERFTKKSKNDALLDIYHFCLPRSERDCNSKVSKRNGRNYTMFTSMNSNLRGYLTVNDKPLCLLDCKNSQPLLLIKLYQDYIRPTPAAKLEAAQFAQDVTIKDKNNCFYTILHGSPFASKQARSDYKAKVLASLYDDPRHGDTNPVWQHFKARYPILAAKMEEIKSDADDFNILALMLQFWESEIFVGILKHFANYEPTFFILGLHDGLLFIDTPENREMLSAMVEKKCREYMGEKIKPVITFDELKRERIWTHKERKPLSKAAVYRRKRRAKNRSKPLSFPSRYTASKI